jgi:hypothetical protein
MLSRVGVTAWKDVLVLSDDGRSVASDYDELYEIASELTARYPRGWGLITIIPPNAVPPPEPVRSAINRALQRSQHMLLGASWCIEGNGLQSAMARAVLTGFRFLTSAPYARHQSHGLDQSFTWLLPRLDGGERRLDDLTEAVAYVTQRRNTLARLHLHSSTPAKAAE